MEMNKTDVLEDSPGLILEIRYIPKNYGLLLDDYVPHNNIRGHTASKQELIVPDVHAIFMQETRVQPPRHHNRDLTVANVFLTTTSHFLKTHVGDINVLVRRWG